MSRYQDQIRDEFNRAVSGATIYVYKVDGSLEALTNDAALSLANPVTTDAFGIFYFNCPDGQHELEVHFNGSVRWKQIIFVGDGAPVPSVPTRALLAAIANPVAGATRFLTESGREGTFVWSSANLSTQVTADTQQGVYVPPASAPTGASGAWVRMREGGYLHIDWFGPVGDGLTDDTAAFVALRTLGIALATDGASGIRRGPEIRLGAKDYYLASDFDCKGFTAKWSGVGGGYDYWNNSGRTVIKMASGKTWYFQAANTEGNTTGTVISAFSCAGSEFHNITWRGPGKGIGTAYLAQMRATCYLYGCRFIEAGSHGLAIIGTVGGGTTTEGNVNVWLMVGGACSLNGGSGIYTNGADANAGSAFGVSFNNNARYGTEEQSFLGNSYYGCHWNANTLGHVNSTAANNTSRFGDYFESGYPVSTISPRSFAFGTNASSQIAGASLQANDAVGSGKGFLGANGFQVLRTDAAKTSNITINTDADVTPGINHVHTDFSGGTGSIRQGMRAGTGIWVEEQNKGSTLWLRVVNGNAGTRHLFGRTAAATGLQGLSNFCLGYVGWNPDGRAVHMAASAPTGDIAQGEIRFNDAPTQTGVADWRCTTGSATTPIWTANYIYARAEPTVGIGYVTGAGSAVTQLTSRTTAFPAINKVCGTLTLVSAAGSTAWQTATVPNSTVAATDVIRVVQASGADKYMIHVTHVAAGTFDITFATTGGVTVEAPVFNFAVIKAVAA